ncbi:MAG TPA: GTPase domain-containing protein [Firmicutes bacterium]|jgi:predicted GTPase|nr:GTPase domain-containing protein [Bacillota bacterium]
MNRCLVIGKTNVGKSVFVLHFARYLGMSHVDVYSQDPEGRRRLLSLAVENAVRTLSGGEPHQTRCLQSITLELPVGKGKRQFEIVDTSGLMDGIHADVSIRRAMAQTLATVRSAQVILHMVDASKAANKGAVEAIGEVDYQVAQFAQMRTGYAILANKMDLPTAVSGLEIIRREFIGHPVFPISALYGQGFKDVKRFVLQCI